MPGFLVSVNSCPALNVSLLRRKIDQAGRLSNINLRKLLVDVFVKKRIEILREENNKRHNESRQLIEETKNFFLEQVSDPRLSLTLPILLAGLIVSDIEPRLVLTAN
jgi:hypothetical protein